MIDRLNTSIVLTLYGWTAHHALLRALVIVCAKWLVFLIPLLLVLAWWWPLPGRSQRRCALLASGCSAMLNGCALLVLSHVVYSPRPFVVLHLVPLFPHAANSSFPSDHMLLGMALAAPLLWRLYRLGWLLCVISLLVGLARVAGAVHWPSDILGTAILALGLGWLALPLTAYALGRASEKWLQWLGLTKKSASQLAKAPSREPELPRSRPPRA